MAEDIGLCSCVGQYFILTVSHGTTVPLSTQAYGKYHKKQETIST